MNEARDDAADDEGPNSGVAPFTQDAQQLGLAWTGWAWDVKIGDFLNNGNETSSRPTASSRGRSTAGNWLQEWP